MPSINNVVLLGHVARPPETRQAGQKTVANFCLAVDCGKDQTAFVEITCWERQAEYIDGTAKGALVCVEGRIVQDEWQDKQTGAKRSKLKVVAHRVGFCRDAKSHGPPRENVDAPGQYQAPAQPQKCNVPF